MEHVKSKLSQYMDRELQEPERRQVESHLSDCGDCRRELEELQAVSKLVSGLARKPLPVGFMARLERRRKAEASPAPRSSFPPVPLRAAAFALSSVLVLFVIYDRSKVVLPPVQDARLAAESASVEPSQEAFAPPVRPPEAAPMAAKAEAPRRALARARGEPLLKTMAGAGAGGSAASVMEADAAARREEARATNEALQRDLERQKVRMGIRRIAAPEPKRFDMGTLASAGAGVPLGPQAMLQISGAGLAESGASIASPTPAPAALGSPIESPQPEEPAAPAGLIIRSETERADTWRRRGITVEAPAVDFARESLAVVVSRESGLAVSIEAVDYAADRITVTYRLMPPPAGADDSSFFQFRVLPKSNLPVLFRQAP